MEALIVARLSLLSLVFLRLLWVRGEHGSHAHCRGIASLEHFSGD